MKSYLQKMKGGEKSPPRKPFSKIAWSWLGAFIGIYLVAILSRFSNTGLLDSLFLVGSFGASAVLIYAAPQVEYAQPRNLIGGHIISAVIGVTVYKLLPFDVALLGAFAVSLSIVAMHFTRTTHPPGGATALIAVIGNAEVHNIGYQFVVSPIAVGAFVMLFIALVVNNLSKNPKRHYPRYWY
ncbi:MAG: HPP family protein [gamma proteobacterium endosymbiont of Lamellibrachia anaximandri]|nr:HPP family protein [gamma proteobacterium endosymbiont of Lamellibrachia anaximandri]MBL3534288.1 HPP family protein [gamma proteobacterium endosymbiont of Lamellibrachia anaximandri]